MVEVYVTETGQKVLIPPTMAPEAVAAYLKAATATQKGKYTGKWTFTWHVWRRLYNVETSKVILKTESKLLEKLKPKVTSIESIKTTVDKTWSTTVAGIYHHHVQATTVTTFTTNTPPEHKSPLFGIDDAVIVGIVIAFVIAAMVVAYFMERVASHVEQVLKVPEVAKAVEAAAEALPTVAVGGTIVVLVLAGLYLWSKRKK